MTILPRVITNKTTKIVLITLNLVPNDSNLTNMCQNIEQIRSVSLQTMYNTHKIDVVDKYVKFKLEDNELLCGLTSEISIETNLGTFYFRHTNQCEGTSCECARHVLDENRTPFDIG